MLLDLLHELLARLRIRREGAARHHVVARDLFRHRGSFPAGSVRSQLEMPAWAVCDTASSPERADEEASSSERSAGSERNALPPGVSRTSSTSNTTEKSASTRARPVSCSRSPPAKSTNSRPACGWTARFPRVLNMLLPG